MTDAMIRVTVDFDVEIRDETALVRGALEDYEAWLHSLSPEVSRSMAEAAEHRKQQMADPDDGPFWSLAWFLSPERQGEPGIPGAEILSWGVGGGEPMDESDED